MLVSFLVLCYLMCNVVDAAPAKAQTNFPQIPTPEALAFMKKYGYIEEGNGESEALYTEDGISEIIKTMQKFGGIQETGKIDNATINLMKSRRCGVPDIVRSKRQKRFIIGPGGWEKRNISYFLANWSPRLGEEKVMKNIQRALDAWGGYGRLNFHRAYGPNADIIVAFGSGYHGDQFPFDGDGGILAHAFFPYEQLDLGGDIHFDNDEQWIDKLDNKDEDGIDFFTVALHELGHSLGLSHSPVRNSVMFPYYNNYDGRQPQLDYDDILGMYNLYIKRVLKEDRAAAQQPSTEAYSTENYSSTYSSEIYPATDGYTSTTYSNRRTTRRVTSTPSTRDYTTPRQRQPTTATDTYTSTRYSYPSSRTTSTPSTRDYTSPRQRRPTNRPRPTTEYSTKSNTKNYSPVTKSDTVSYHGDDESVDDHKEHDDKHTLPEHNSPSLPNICDGHVDAVATLRNELFVFRDQFIWRYKTKGRLETGYPVLLHTMFPKLPKSVNKIDAIYQRLDGFIVIFVGNQFWVYDGHDFVENSPQPISKYGIPEYVNNIDAVQNWSRNRKTYLYKGDRFWRYNETTRTLDEGYPLLMERWRGVPEDLDAATTWKDGVTYFFKGPLFWKFDNNWVSITDESPMPTAEIWFGCPEEPKKMSRLFP